MLLQARLDAGGAELIEEGEEHGLGPASKLTKLTPESGKISPHRGFGLVSDAIEDGLATIHRARMPEEWVCRKAFVPAVAPAQARAHGLSSLRSHLLSRET